MFESIYLGRPGLFGIADLGKLAEALLYYQRVHLVVSASGFDTLIRVCGPETLLGLMSDGHLHLIYQENAFLVATNPAIKGCGLGAWESPIHASQNHIPAVLTELLGKPGRARRLGNRIIQRLSPRRYDPALARERLDDISGAAYLDNAACAVVEYLAPGYTVPDGSRFRFYRDSGDSYNIETNLDFLAANRFYQRVNPDSSLDSTQILLYLHEGIANVFAAAEEASEVATARFESVLAANKIGQIIDKATASTENIHRFQDLVLSAKSVGGAIQSGERSFEDLRHLLGEARKFREWLGARPDEAETLREYLAACSRLSWLDKLPHKLIKYVLFGSAGLVTGAAFGGAPGAVLSLGLGAADTFLLDRLVSGWKPSQFVSGSLIPFVTPKV